MPIIRCSDQNKQTLEEFYSEWSLENNQISSEIGKSMLMIIDLINKTFLETKIYGLTSHANLLLLSQDNSQSDWYVVILANGLQEYHIEYLMPKNKSPWINATVRGATKSLIEFKKLIIFAMLESQAWNESTELKYLYAQIKENNL